MSMNGQTLGNMFAALYCDSGLQSGALGSQTNALNAYNNLGWQQFGAHSGMQNAYRSPAQQKLDRARATAAEVRARRPEMQVRKLA